MPKFDLQAMQSKKMYICQFFTILNLIISNFLEATRSKLVIYNDIFYDVQRHVVDSRELWSIEKVNCKKYTFLFHFLHFLTTIFLRQSTKKYKYQYIYFLLKYNTIHFYKNINISISLSPPT